MAEGQLTLYWAREFQPLIGERLHSVNLPRKYAEADGSLLGLRVERFETRGKHMLLHLSDDRVIHCHAMMFGGATSAAPL